MDYKYIIIGIVLLIVLFAILKSMKKDAHLEVNKLIDYLGGVDNILDKQVNLSRFIVTLRDVSLANKEEIQKLGAKGIVEIGNQLKIILGSNSRQLKKYIDDIDKISYHIFMRKNNEIKVYLRIFEKDKETAQIGRVVTKEDERRKGYAFILMKKGIELIKNEMKKNKIYLEGQVYCHQLYLKLGFKIISDEFLEDGIPHYKMLMTLD